MREIKFRAWCEGRHEALTFSNPHYEYDIYIHNGKYVNTETWEIYGDIESVPIEQFTGLHDKNGKEIYEGDIIHHYLGVDVVKWDVDGFTVGDWEPRGLEDFLHTCEVIGNIHEATK